MNKKTHLLVDFSKIFPPQFYYAGHLTGQVGASQKSSLR